MLQFIPGPQLYVPPLFSQGDRHNVLEVNAGLNNINFQWSYQWESPWVSKWCTHCGARATTPATFFPDGKASTPTPKTIVPKGCWYLRGKGAVPSSTQLIYAAHASDMFPPLTGTCAWPKVALCWSVCFVFVRLGTSPGTFKGPRFHWLSVGKSTYFSLIPFEKSQPLYMLYYTLWVHKSLNDLCALI